MRKHKSLYYLGAFFINLAIISIIFWSVGLVPFGDNNFLSSDLGTQYIDFLTELRRHLVNNNLHLYLFSQSLGDNFFPIVSYYLLSPFNLLLVLFKNYQIPVAADILIMLKISTMGVTMALFLSKYFKKIGSYNYIFTIAYSFCGFVASYFYDLMWLDALIMLPLVAIGIMRIVENNKLAGYYFALLFAIIFNYYLGYMLCFFSVAFFIYLIMERDILKMDNRVQIIRNYIITSVLAGLSSAVVLLPTFAGMLNTGKSNFDLTNYLPSFRFGFEAFTQLGIGGNTFIQRLHHGPSVFMTSTVLILLLSYFFSDRVSRKEKINSAVFMGILVVSMLITTFNTIWHMFQNPAGFPFRNSFIFTFICIFIAYKAFDDGVFKDKNALIKSTSTAGILICIGYTTLWLIPKLIEKMNFETPDNTTNGYYFWVSIICIVASGFALYLFSKDKKYQFLVLLLVIFEVVANFDSVIATADFGSQHIYSRQYKLESEALSDAKHDSKPGHRIIVSKSGINKAFPEQYNNYNDPMLFDINGLSLYSSTLNQETMMTLNNLGYFSKNVRRISSSGGTELTNALFGINYNIRQDNKKYKIIDNYDAPTMAFMVDPAVYDFQMMPMRALDNQNRLWQALTGANTQFMRNAQVDSMKQQRINKKTRYNYQLTTTANGVLYFYVSPINYNSSKIYVNGKRIDPSQVLIENQAVMELGKFEDGQAVNVQVVTKQPMDVSPGYFKTLDVEPFLASKKVFKANSLKITSDLKHDTIKGSINAKKASPLFVSVPYDKGWKAYDNGKKVKINKVVGNLMAVDLDKGHHHIVFKYEVPGLKTGWIVTLVSLVLFGLFQIYVKFFEKTSPKKRSKIHKQSL
ncbi:YfhO family protein [Companilactobacillus mishanensis]|uniref:YfhO family protein n=1 Tax=Companilactobacillus mishanensis TaxID=2486008 RepID=A0A5P0ZHH7_9LACO|nr:YfhO family protein [Companilactobacillus mishanensis]MQS52484.1 YfhO family protein [Companilactobacillus mishanensis]